MIRTCEVKLGKSVKADERLFHALDLLRVLYNAALEERIGAWRKQRKSVSRFDQYKSLTEIRSANSDYAALPAEMTRLTTLTRLDLAFKAFFRRVKKGEKASGFPRFKGRGRFNTFVFGSVGWKLDGKHLVLKLGGRPLRLRMKNTIHREGPIKGLRLVRKDERWFAHFVVDIGPAPVVSPAKRCIGIDVGIKIFAMMNDGSKVGHPRFLKKSCDELKEAQQKLSMKKRGSNRRERALIELRRVYEKIVNRRKDFVRQTVADLAKKHDGFIIEDLNVKQMMSKENNPKGLSPAQSRGMRRGIMDSSWSAFFTSLASKAEEAGMPFVRVDPRGTSQRCSGCGERVQKDLRERVHNCTNCGLVLDRDLNAAMNIYNLRYRLACADAHAEAA